MKLVFATSNVGKIRDVNSFFVASGLEIEVVSPIQYLAEHGRDDLVPEVEETGATYEENAALKSHSLCEWLLEKTGETALQVFGDDSGLEVKALNGEPGLYSARYAGEGCTVSDNNQKLLEELRSHTERSARFICVIALTTFRNAHKTTQYFRGELDGTIRRELQGAGGFGYDPLFEVRGLGKTLADLKSGTELLTSHRTKALALLVDGLKSQAAW